MLERGVSLARIRYAFKQHQRRRMGPVLRIHHQALHAAGRTTGLAGLPPFTRGQSIPDPELQSGKIKPEEAYRVLEQT